MKITCITGSTNKNGTSSLLAYHFIQGAIDKGHKVFRFDAAFKNVHPCIGCLKCKRGENECIFKDDMFELYPKLLESDVICYSTPLYYHTYTAQLKAVIDRYYAKDKFLKETLKRTILLVSAANPNDWVTHGIVSTYKTTLKYLKWEDAGKILAINCETTDDIKKTCFLQQAYNMGYNLG